MRYIKLSLAVLLVAIITNFATANASAIFSRITVIEFLTKHDTSYTNYYTKNDWGSQEYKNVDTFTNLTNPCPKCVIKVQAHRDDGDKTPALLTVMDKNYIFTSIGENPGEWRLSLERYDSTLLNTTTKGYWHLNETGPEV